MSVAPTTQDDLFDLIVSGIFYTLWALDNFQPAMDAFMNEFPNHFGGSWSYGSKPTMVYYSENLVSASLLYLSSSPIYTQGLTVYIAQQNGSWSFSAYNQYGNNLVTNGSIMLVQPVSQNSDTTS
jgi:hypothetical protein